MYKSPIPGMLTPSGKQSYGPERVMPGKLSVSRTIGDILAKNPKFGGNPNVVIANPDIYLLNVKETDDFIILGSKNP